MSATTRLTLAQALVRFLAAQHSERDGERRRLIAGCFGIFGHGNVAGLGQALHQHHELLPYHPAKNEQAMVHIASGYARQCNRLSTFACTSSVGPGATNMVTGAALATINRLPVLLLPGDTFASRAPHPVLQQLEYPGDATVSVNDALRPVSRFFERIERPEQLISAALEAMRVLTDPAETGAVTLALPEDVQAEAHDFPEAFLAPRTWTIYRRPPAPEALARAVALLRSAQRPLIVAGGGVIYSAATAALRELVEATGIPVAETQAGRGALVSEHPLSLGAVGATGTLAANRLAREADLVLGVGTRWSDFTTASKSAFQDPGVRFVNLNLTGFDAAKLSGLPLEADARVGLEQLRRALTGHRAPAVWERRAASESAAWAGEVARLVAVDDAAAAAPAGAAALPTQAAVIGAINDAAGERGVVVCAAGSAPGDLHKLWRARDPDGKGYHVEYGYSCMGYEIPGAIGVKLAAPEREVFALVGDGSYLMLPGELVTAVAERVPLTIVLVDNHGYASIGALSRSLGSHGFGTHHRRALEGVPPTDHGQATGLADPSASEPLPVDLAANAASLGARVLHAPGIPELRAALSEARVADGPVVIVVETDRYAGVPGYEGWWEVPVAAVSQQPDVNAARARYEQDLPRQRLYLAPAEVGPQEPSQSDNESHSRFATAEDGAPDGGAGVGGADVA
ncbi:MAG: 3D-(3,5/4)-trihydroxycyclohexane-1,2-dione acylhydrolase (decyclizing) [Acidobacteriota bacterium]|nr:3D-(3,5/4)-trihydroxycyclohexane-1,2-dione acylhydrolase (decyclizing) [Acidobacteriota bacterium]